MALVVLAVAVGALGLTACVADPPPTIGTAIPGNAQAVVTWQPPLAAPSPINAYVVTPWIGFTRQTPVVFNSPATTETVTGLTNGVTYTFTVHAVNAHGDDSAESSMSNPVMPTATARALYDWGDNTYGQLGNGTTTNHTSPIQIGTATNWATVSADVSHTAAIKTDGTLWTWGDNTYGQLGDGSFANHASPVQVGVGHQWVIVAAGGNDTMAVAAS